MEKGRLFNFIKDVILNFFLFLRDSFNLNFYSEILQSCSLGECIDNKDKEQCKAVIYPTLFADIFLYTIL